MFETPRRADFEGLEVVTMAALREGTAPAPCQIVWTNTGHGNEAWAVDTPELRSRRSDRVPEQSRLIRDITHIDEATALAQALGIPFNHLIVRFR